MFQNSKCPSLLEKIASFKKMGIHFFRFAVLVIFMWIGGLKFWHYEANGIVPFVANSPFMSFFYAKKAPEYKNYKIPEGARNEESEAWHEQNHTYTFSKGLGIAIMVIGLLFFLGIFSAPVGLIGSLLVIIMTFTTLSFLITTPEVWVPNKGSHEFGFPLLSGAGRLVLKDIAFMAGAFISLSDCAQRILNKSIQKQKNRDF